VRRRIIGWKEKVSLPDLGISQLEAKIDSGAKTSALHAVDLRPFEQDGETLISFSVPLTHHRKVVRCTVPVADQRAVKNTSGEWSTRFFIRTTLLLGSLEWLIELSLADRERMDYDIIVGRTAIKGRRILIDPQRTFLAEASYPDIKTESLT
jgi:hypothetical protein